MDVGRYLVEAHLKEGRSVVSEAVERRGVYYVLTDRLRCLDTAH
jgi:hypothetical protein